MHGFEPAKPATRPAATPVAMLASDATAVEPAGSVGILC